MSTQRKKSLDPYLVARPAEELERVLAERLDVLMVLCREYDRGKRHFASDIACCLRTLFDSASDRKDPSLLRQLGRDKTALVDTVEMANDGDRMWSTQPVEGMAIALTINTPGGLVQTREPTLESVPTEQAQIRTEFSVWWTSPFVFSGSLELSRKRLMKLLAEQEGGAHVAARIDRIFFELTRGQLDFVRQTVFNGDLRLNPTIPGVAVNTKGAGTDLVGAVVRQIAHEALLTLLPDTAEYLSSLPTPRESMSSIAFIRLHLVEPRSYGHHSKGRS